MKGEPSAFPLIHRDFEQEDGRFSPDGQWVAYASNESGRWEVLARRFKASADTQSAVSSTDTLAVSTAGGRAPRWRADGKELYFIAQDGTVMAADVRMGATLSVGVPHALFRVAGSQGDWDVVRDGSRFLIAIRAGDGTSGPFTILWNRLRHLRASFQP